MKKLTAICLACLLALLCLGAAAEGEVTIETSAVRVLYTDTLRITVRAPGATKLRLYEGMDDYFPSCENADGEEHTFSIQHGYAVTLDYYAEALIGGEWVRSAVKTVEFYSDNGALGEPQFSCGDSFLPGSVVTVTLTAAVTNAESYFAMLLDPDGMPIESSPLALDAPATLKLPAKPGAYSVWVYASADGWDSGNASREITAAWPDLAERDILLTVSAEKLYCGNSVYVMAYAPGAEAVRIYRVQDEMTELARQEDGNTCEYSIQYNSAATLQFWAVARYHGVWAATTSETKTVVFESHGRLGEPTFDCGTTFARGQTITITRTNDVPNAETYLAFLSTPEHDSLDSRNFNGEATVTMTAPDTPGTYVVSVCVMAPGWNNNQTDLEITVTDSEAPAHPPISITLSGRVLPTGGTLTVTATAEGAQRVRICEGNDTVTFPCGEAAGDRCEYVYPYSYPGGHQFFAEADYGDGVWTNRSGYRYMQFAGVLKLPAGLKTVESGAFAGLKVPVILEFPATVTEIAEDAFTGSDVTFLPGDCEAAAAYAAAHDILCLDFIDAPGPKRPD